MNKTQLRRQLLKQRQALSTSIWQEKSKLLCEQLQSLPLFQSAHKILAYFSVRQEPDLSSLFDSSAAWGFPRCVEKELVWHRWSVGDRRQIGSYNILEPEPNSPILSVAKVDLILIPAVACDHQGYRLGYGGGYYDRLLSDPFLAKIPTIGVVFEFAYLPAIPIESWDIPLSLVCTENSVYHLNKI